MSKVAVGTNIWLPMPVSIVGTVNNLEENYMSVGWVSRVNINPPLMAIGIGKARQTNKNISENKEFSINFPSQKDIVRADYVGLVSGKKKSKTKVFESIYGSLKKAPLIQDCPLSIACKLLQKIELPDNDLFIGEVVEVFAENEYVEGKTFRYQQAKTFLLTMPDNIYWSIGAAVGKAWSDGKQYE